VQRFIAFWSSTLQLPAPTQQGGISDLPLFSCLKSSLKLDVCHV